MARRRYLMAYDIADPKRLRRICTVMENHGNRLQYSVFLCDLSRAELVELELRVTAVMDFSQDSVVQIDMGPVSACVPVRWFGKRKAMPSSGGPQIV